MSLTAERPADTPTPPTLTPARRWVLAVGLVFVVVFVGYAALMLVAVLGRTSYERNLTFTPATERLTIDTNHGDVRIVAAAGPEVRVTKRVRYGLSEPRTEESVGPDGLALRSTCNWITPCSVDYVIALPPGFTVDARSSSGDIRVDGTSGPLRIDTSAGDVRGNDLRSTEVTAESSAGDVNLDFATPPERVSVQSSAGDVRVTVPAVTGAYRVDVDTSVGDTRVTVPTDPASTRRIRADTSAGDVEVRLAD
jgi:Putative adhesin